MSGLGVLHDDKIYLPEVVVWDQGPSKPLENVRCKFCRFEGKEVLWKERVGMEEEIQGFVGRGWRKYRD